MEKLLTVDQVCELLQVSKSLVYKWVHYGYIPHVKIGKILRFREIDLIGWLKRRSQKGRKNKKLIVDNLIETPLGVL